MSTVTDKVFLHYTQAELDRAYDQSVWAPNGPALHQQNAARSEAVRQRHPCKIVSYGPTSDETLEIVPCRHKNAPVIFFIHGGRWLPQPGDPFIYWAETANNAGAHFIGARFTTLTATPGEFRLPDMVDQLRRAVLWVVKHAQEIGADPQQIHIVGHSSGAHLTSVLLTTDWTRFGLPPTVFKTGTCISGMYDLEPVMISARSSYVQLNPDEVDQLSAIRHLDRIHCPILVAYGDKESPEFQRHAQIFSSALQECGHEHTLEKLRNSNHFEGVASLFEQDAPLTQALLRHLALVPG